MQGTAGPASGTHDCTRACSLRLGCAGPLDTIEMLTCIPASLCAPGPDVSVFLMLSTCAPPLPLVPAGRKSPWAEVYDPARPPPVKSLMEARAV